MWMSLLIKHLRKNNHITPELISLYMQKTALLSKRGFFQKSIESIFYFKEQIERSFVSLSFLSFF